jgi:hypothetical protein
MRIGFFTATGLLAALGACSTIVEGRTQQISVNTDPPGATCDFTREGLKIASVDPTPGTTIVEKTKDDITIVCDKDGYETATLVDKSGAAAATAGNIIFGLIGGPVAWIIDSATGADNKYDSPVNVSLTKK